MTLTHFPRVVIVTGASRGIGAAVARLAGMRGAAVAVNYAREADEARHVVAAIEASGGKAIAVQGDVSREEDVRRLFETAQDQLGPLEGLVNNAGIVGGMAKVIDLEAAMLDRVLAVNVTGSFLCAREALRRMATSRGGSGGAIVNLSSIAARLGGAKEWVHYAASKGAIDSFTLGLAREAAEEGVRVNAVAPGLTETDMGVRDAPAGRTERVMPTIPLARLGQPEEIAEAVIWLLSPAASYVTGAIMEVSGGR